MQVGRMKDEEEAVKYVEERLVKVKEILDDIADQTGVVYVCLNAAIAECFGMVGTRLITALTSIMQVVPDRLDMANKARDIAYEANKRAEEESTGNLCL